MNRKTIAARRGWPPRFGGNEAGQDLAEYAILVGLIAVVVVGALTVFGAQLVALFQRITGALPFG